MDPNEALRIALEWANKAAEGDAIDSADQMQAAEALLGLNSWIEKGGFLPEVWTNARSD